MRDQYKVLQEAYEQVVEAHDLQKLSDEDKLAIVDLYNKGILNNIPDQTNQQKLADMAGVNRRTIGRILDKYKSGGVIKSGEKMDSSGNIVPNNQQFPPDQVNYIYKLLSTKEEREVNGTYPFAYSSITIENMLRDHIKNHPELTVGWVSPGKGSVEVYTHKYQEKLGRPRTDDGVRMKDGRIKYTPKVSGDIGARSSGGTRQQSFGALGPDDGSYRTAMGRAQIINDPDV